MLSTVADGDHLRAGEHRAVSSVVCEAWTGIWSCRYGHAVVEQFPDRKGQV
jgi:hypothetical protein